MNHTSENPDKIKHALRYSIFNRFYDGITSVTCRERYFKTRMLQLPEAVDPGPAVDIACGTGTFVRMYKDAYPKSAITGIDADEKILDIARQKTRGLDGINFVHCYSRKLNLPDASAKTVYCGLFYHHLDHPNKLETTREAMRILVKGGKYVVCDWGRPSGIFTATGFLMVRMLDGFDTTAESMRDIVPEVMKESGFIKVAEQQAINTVFGTLKIWSGEK